MDESMMEMVDSVKQYGVLVPALVRPKPEGGYEMIAGHRRRMASELAEKQDKEKHTVPRKVQDVIPIRRMWGEGIFQVGSKYSKSYQFSDINYQVASLEDKKVMFLDYSELLNSLDSGATTKITINNRRLNRAKRWAATLERSLVWPQAARTV